MDEAVATGVWREIRRRYDEQHRAYHNLAHLQHGFAEMNRWAEHVPITVELAWWFHDAVYDPRRTDNEQRSAFLACELLSGRGLSARQRERITSLIMATQHTQPTTDRWGKFLVDIDLTILGQPRPRFRSYEKQIRMEYNWVPWPQYVAGRTAVLQKFLARPSIYATRRIRNKYEAVARANIEDSLARLGDNIDPLVAA